MTQKQILQSIHKPMTAKQIAQKTNQKELTTRRKLKKLYDYGFIDRRKTKNWQNQPEYVYWTPKQQ